eukprot:3818545-Amphidinium_carterae.1
MTFGRYTLQKYCTIATTFVKAIRLVIVLGLMVLPTVAARLWSGEQGHRPRGSLVKPNVPRWCSAKMRVQMLVQASETGNQRRK